MSLNAFTRKLGADHRGNVAMLFGLALLPAAGMVGAAVDIQAVRTERQQMQDALDAATLALMSHGVPTSTAEANRRLQAYYVANGGQGRAQLDQPLNINAIPLVGRTKATFTKPTMIVGFLGIETADIEVNAAGRKAMGELTNVAFRLKHITGAYDKRISLFGLPRGGTSEVELMQIVYTNPDARQTGTTTISKLVNGTMTPVARKYCSDNTNPSSCTTTVLSGDGTADVELDNYTNLVMQMTVSASNPIAAAYLWPGMPRTIRTDDPNLSYRLFVGGTQVAFGTRLSLTDSIPCGDWSSQDWEDGGNGGISLLLSRTDVHYDVRGTCTTAVSDTGASLVR